jgi:hypothetical protein
VSAVPTGGDLSAAGLFSSSRPVASVKERLGIPGTDAPERSLAVRLMGGLDFEVLPGRGFDVGDTYLRGIPLSWFSPVADARALPSLAGRSWLSRFTGGLITTCGLSNIGPATDTVGMHGDFSHLPAREVSYGTSVSPEVHSATLAATIDSVSLFGPSFRVRRVITASAHADGTATLSVRDDVTNVGTESAALSLLYHVNLGAPLIAPGSRVRVESQGVRAREPHPHVPDWSVLPQPADHTTESVFEHSAALADEHGFAKAAIASPDGGLGIEVAWTAATLPRLYQWVFPTRGRWALGIEPSSAPLFGEDRTGPNAGAPIVPPGETREHEIRVTVRGETGSLGR